MQRLGNNEGSRDTLRLSERQQRALLAFLDAQCNADLELDDQRIQQRFDFSGRALLIRISQPGGTSGSFMIRPRNLSRTGMGFLHGSFCYPGSPCELAIPTCDAELSTVSGKIVRCRHVRANIHELGMKFNEPIELSRFVKPGILGDDDDGRASQKLPKLTGRCLLVDPSTDTRELFDFIAVHLGLTAVTTLDGPSARSIIATQDFDVVLVDHDLASSVSPTLVNDLREAGYGGPIVATVLEPQADEDMTSLLAEGFSGRVVKPLNFDRLLAGLSPHLSRDWRGQRHTEPLFSEHWSKKAMQPLILAHLERLEHRLSDVHGALREQDTLKAGRVLREIAGSAGGFGYPQISDAAMQLAQALASDASSEQRRACFDHLAELGAAACKVRKRRP